MYQLDAFTGKVFSGNQAAVCLLEEWPEPGLMQNIAAENNLAETAFVLLQNNVFEIRWFTPTTEVDLCGHATLAAAYVLFHEWGYAGDEILFQTQTMGILKVSRQGEMYFLDFPTDSLTNYKNIGDIEECIHVQPLEVYKGRSDIMAVLRSEDEVKKAVPDFAKISALPSRGLIITSAGNKADFVSRFFAPQSGIPEDPVTGSAHTTLIPYWAEKLQKKELSARQLSARGGALQCVFSSNRCLIGGRVVLFLKGEIYI